jgi:hypothetical protein
MQRKLIPGAIPALPLAVTSVSLTLASGDPKGDKNGDKVRVSHVTVKNSQETPLNLGAPEPSIGDRFRCSVTCSATTSGSAWPAMGASPCCSGPDRTRRPPPTSASAPGSSSPGSTSACLRALARA